MERILEPELMDQWAQAEMLYFARKQTEVVELSNRIEFLQGKLPDFNWPYLSADAVISNSLLHHLPDGSILWNTALRLTKPDAPIFVVDLTRPPSIRTAKELVIKHTQGEPELMKIDFYRSLRAAFRPEEVRIQLDELGLQKFKVEVISDRHMMIYGRA